MRIPRGLIEFVADDNSPLYNPELKKENEIIFRVNDVETFTYTKRSHFTKNEWPFDQPAYLIMNVAVGGNLGGTVDINDIPDMRMMIDYVRVYKAPSD